MADSEDSLLLKAINEHFIDYSLTPISYTRPYYSWKKFQNISRFFGTEIKGKEGGIKIIDVGCGLGANIFYLNKDFNQGNNLEFSGVDLDSERICYCKSKKERYQAKNVVFNVGNAEKLGFADNYFDILLSVETLEHLKDPRLVANEFYRVLKPGGLAIITTPNETNTVLKFKKLLSCFKQGQKIEKEKEVFDSFAGGLGVSYGHISVKGIKEWIKIFSECKFKIEGIGRGSLLSGTPKHDKHRAVFALALLAEGLLDRLPAFYNLSEDVILSLRKN